MTTPTTPPPTMTDAPNPRADAEARRLLDMLVAYAARRVGRTNLETAAWGVIAQADCLAVEARALAGHVDHLKRTLD